MVRCLHAVRVQSNLELSVFFKKCYPSQQFTVDLDDQLAEALESISFLRLEQARYHEFQNSLFR